MPSDSSKACRHQHGSDHSHHNHAHHHIPAAVGQGRAFFIGILLNSLFVVIEYGYGMSAHSLALMADATHNLGDVLSLVLAWGGSVLARRAPDARYTYGLRGSSILAALANAILLLLVTGGLAWEAIERINSPQTVIGSTVMWVAACGVVINGLTAWLFMSGSKSDINIKGAYLHMLADALVSLAVVVVGGLVIYTGWLWLDPMVTLLLVVVITWGTWALLRDAVRLALQAVPADIELSTVRRFLAEQPGVTEVHDVHIWAMSTTENALTAHLLCPSGHPGDAFLHQVAHEIEHRFGIHHVTLQIELADTTSPCTLAPDHVV